MGKYTPHLETHVLIHLDIHILPLALCFSAFTLQNHWHIIILQSFASQKSVRETKPNDTETLLSCKALFKLPLHIKKHTKLS